VTNINKKYHIKNRNKRLNDMKKYRKENEEKLKKQDNDYYYANKDKILDDRKIYYQKNKNKVKEDRKNYCKNNKIKIAQKQNEYNKRKRKQDINFKIRSCLRSRLNGALKNTKKIGSSIKDLGCTIQELWKHLENQFHPNPKNGKYMTKTNLSRKGWHIDHIIPLSYFDLTDREQFLIANNYLNLQPLWAEENLKKSNILPKNYKTILRKIKKNIKRAKKS